MRCRAVLLLAGCLAVTPLAAQSTAPAWTYTSSDSILSFEVTSVGSAAIRTVSSFSIVDMTTGVALWSRPSWRGGGRLPSLAPFVLFGDSVLDVVDLQSGTSPWSLDGAPTTDLRYITYIPELDLVLTSGARGDSVVVTAIGGDSGDVRWQRADWFATLLSQPARTGIVIATQPPLVDSDSTIVLYPALGGPIRIDVRSGRILWRAVGLAERDVPNVRATHVKMLAHAGRIVVPIERGLAAIDQTSGDVLWDSSNLYLVPLGQLVATLGGLVVAGGGLKPFIDVVSLASGRSQWPKAFTKRGTATPFVVSGELIFVAYNYDLLEFAVASGARRDVLKLPLSGEERPRWLESRDFGILVSSDQSLMLVDGSGNVRFHSYYPAPGPSSFAWMARIALMAAVNSLTGSWAQATANRTGQTVVYPIILVNPFLGARHRSTVAAQDVHILFAHDERGPQQQRFSFVRLDKRTGRPTGRVWIDDETITWYVDPPSGTVLVQTGKTTLSALRFP